MANPLPTVGGDSGVWGTKLNAFLSVEHNSETGVHTLGTGLVTDTVNTVEAAGATYTIPAPSTAGINFLTLTADCTLTFPTAVAGQSFSIVFKQGGAGSFTITWPSLIVKWDSGIAPTLTVTVGAIDIVSFMCVDGTNWYGFAAGSDMK